MRCAARISTFCGYLEREIDITDNSSDTPCEDGPRNFYI